MGTANTIPSATAAQQGAGLIDLAEALSTPTPENAVQTHARSTGAGSLDAARGSVVVEVDGDTAWVREHGTGRNAALVPLARLRLAGAALS